MIHIKEQYQYALKIIVKNVILITVNQSQGHSKA